MSAISSYTFVPLLVASAAVAVAYVALLAVRRLHRDVVALRRELADHRTPAVGTAGLVPAPRSAPDAEEIRTAVVEALAEERERELAEARAFWAAQETADSPVLDGPGADAVGFDAPFLDGPVDRLRLPEFEALPFLPRQVDRLGQHAEPEAARRHPSDPEFAPSPVVADPEQTIARLTVLAEAGTPLADVRPGPLGTLDLYVFTDGTTLCLTPGHRETADQLSGALERGEAPVLLGGSGVSGAYALTFTYGSAGDTRSVFILADRIVASL